MKDNKTLLLFGTIALCSIFLYGCGGNKQHVHTFSEEWSKDETYHWHEATCGHDVISDKGEHVYGEWTTVTPATTHSEGYQIRVCSVCAYEQGEAIPQIVDDDKDISSYTISYLQDDIAAQYSAKELYSVIGDKVKDIKSTDEVDTNKDNIYLKIDNNLNEKYKIEHIDNAFILSSDTSLGLIEASRNLLDVIDTEEEIESWYQTPVSDNYVLRDKAKIMSFNVRVADDGTLGNGDSGNIVNRLPRVVKTINTYMPDTVGVQEASDIWINGLKERLMPQYGYIGFGREANYKGESSGIFYNRDRVSLIEGKTYWLSDTPEVAGSHFDDYGGYNRIMTYGIFERFSDGYRFLHVNTHLDLKNPANQKDAIKCDEILSQYKDELPIFLTGDFNCKAEDIGWAYDEFVNKRGYIDSKYEALDSNSEQYTYIQDGYKSGVDSKEIIDFCLKANRGLYFTKYLVDTNKYSGDDIEKPQLSSDHYPIYLEAIPYEPLFPFSNDSETKNISIDNGFALHNQDFELVKHKSNYKNAKEVVAYKSNTNGLLVDKSLNFTKHSAINLSLTNGYLEYKFDCDEEGLGDLNIVMANCLTNPNGMKDLSNYIDLTLNGTSIDLGNLDLRCSDIRSELFEWENIIIRDASLNQGENVLRIDTKDSEAPYQLLLEIFSDNEVTPIESDDDETSYFYINLGSEQITLKKFNETYQDQKSTAVEIEGEKYLTMELLDNKEIDLKMADGVSDLDASLDFTNFKEITITGSGTLNVKYTDLFDGIACNNITIDKGVTVNLTGFSDTNKTGIKAYGILQIDGTLNIDHFGYGLAITDEKDVDLAINVGKTGTLNITNSQWGVYCWGKPAGHSASINIAGQTTISTAKCPFMVLAEKISINLTDSAVANIVSSEAVGIYSYGNIYVRDNASLNIDCYGGGIFGVKTLMVGNGTVDNPETNNASLNLICGGNKSTNNKDDTNQGMSKDGNIIQSGGTGTINMIFTTMNKVWIECRQTGKTGIQFSSTGTSNRMTIKCADMTIKTASNAIGCWVTNTSDSYLTSTYDYSSPYNKLKLINCNNICNSTKYNNAKRFAPFLEDGAVEISTQ